MDVRIEATVATMDVLVSRIRVAVVKRFVQEAAAVSTAVASFPRLLSRGNTSQNAVAPDFALFKGPEALV